MTARSCPPDRRTPVPIARGQCPAKQLCGCCHGVTGKGHPLIKDKKTGRLKRQHCPLPHPGEDKPACRPPVQRDIPPCPERDTLPAAAGPLAACVECGRVTARRWTDPFGRQLAWCAGRQTAEEAT